MSGEDFEHERFLLGKIVLLQAVMVTLLIRRRVSQAASLAQKAVLSPVGALTKSLLSAAKGSQAESQEHGNLSLALLLNLSLIVTLQASVHTGVFSYL